jgi:DNA repair protein RadC
LLKSLAPEVKLRILRGKKVNTTQIKSAKDSIDILRKFIPASKMQTQEFAVAIYLNNNNNVLAVYQFGMGGITATVMDKRLLLAAALKLGATSIILCHNHPSGNLTPSGADKEITKDIIKIADLHLIKVLDHIILTKDAYYSFAEQGLI